MIQCNYGTDWTSAGSFNMDGFLDERQMLEMIRGNNAERFVKYHNEVKKFILDNFPVATSVR